MDLGSAPCQQEDVMECWPGAENKHRFIGRHSLGGLFEERDGMLLIRVYRAVVVCQVCLGHPFMLER